MTASQLSRACLKMYDGASSEIRRFAASGHYSTEVDMCRLHWLGLVSIKPKAKDRLEKFYRWLISQDLGKYL